MADLGVRLLRTWNRWSRLPGGRWLFSRLVGRVAPYSGSIAARVRRLEPGLAVVGMRDRRQLRNPFASVHAVALANLGELASGLALWTRMPPELRGIVTGLTVRFARKARGPMVAESRVTLPAVAGPTPFEATAVIRDAAGETVADVTVTWLLDRRP